MKVMCSLGCHYNGFVTTHTFWHMMHGDKFLVPMNQKVLNRLSRKRHVIGHTWFNTSKEVKSQKLKWASAYLRPGPY